MGEIQDGDIAFDENGKPCRVVVAHDVLYDRECFEVEFSTGEKVVCDGEHLWRTWDKRERRSGVDRRLQREPSVRTTKEIAASLLWGREEFNHSIETCGPLDLPDADLPVDPYVLGAWLGDGSKSGSGVFGIDESVFTEIGSAGYDVSPATGNSSSSRTAYGLVTDLRKAGVVENKHVPAMYMRASASQRLSLLQGLMDTDGCASDQCKGKVEFCNTNLQLAESVLEIARSLGIRAVMATGRAKLYGKDCGPKYRVTFTTDLPVFRMPRKMERMRQRSTRYRRSYTTHRKIVAVRPVPSVPVRCITVDSPNSLYLCSRGMIPTHNTLGGIIDVVEGVVRGESWGWFSPSYKFSTEVWRELCKVLAPVTEKKNAQEYRLETINGGIVEIWTLQGVSAEDVARGRKYHGVVVDEAGLIEGLIEVFNAAIRPTLVDYAGTALFLGTPKGRRHGFVQLYARGEVGENGWKSFKAKTTDNPFIPPEEVEAARRELPDAVFKQEFEAEPSDDGLNPFGLNELANAVQPASKKPTICYGIDLARAHDWTVVVGLDEWGRWTHYDRWQAPWAETKQRIRRLSDTAPCLVDGTGVGDAIFDDLAMAGMNVHKFTFHVASKRELVQRLIAAFAGQRVTIAEGIPYTEFKAFEVSYTSQGKVRYTSPNGVHDDAIMAWGLALTMYERMGAIPPDDITERIDYLKLEMDPDANPALQAALIARDQREGRYDERNPYDSQFSDDWA